jgi:hypothetical protein
MTAPPTVEALPDSRLSELKGLVFDKEFGWLRPIFCASCGKPGGYVPVDMTFAFYMCTSPCWETFGLKTEFMGIPDAIVRKAIEQDKLASANYRESANVVE